MNHICFFCSFSCKFKEINTQLIETNMKSRLLILLTAAVFMASCPATGVTMDELAERLERIEKAVLKFAHVVSFEFTYH